MAADVVLVVEDDANIRQDLAFLIRMKGFNVETASHGEEALQKLDQMGSACMIILDLMMPVMDGWELRAALLEDPRYADITVIVLSGIASAQTAKGLKAVDYLTKPIDFGKLYKLVDTYC
jgi:CheY-like chemotaxis protein